MGFNQYFDKSVCLKILLMEYYCFIILSEAQKVAKIKVTIAKINCITKLTLWYNCIGI